MLALSNVTGLTDLSYCNNVTSEGLGAVSSLTALTSLSLTGCANVTGEVLRALSRLTVLTTLNLRGCDNVTSEGLQTLSSLTALTSQRALQLQRRDERGASQLSRPSSSATAPT